MQRGEYGQAYTSFTNTLKGYSSKTTNSQKLVTQGENLEQATYSDWQSTMELGNHPIATKQKVTNQRIKDGPKRRRTGNVKTDLACTGRERLNNPRIRKLRTQHMRIAKFAVEASRREGASVFICPVRRAGQSLSGEVALISRKVIQPRRHTTAVVLKSPESRVKAQAANMN